MDENKSLKKSAFEQYENLPADSKMKVISSVRESLDKEILEYQQGIDYQTKQFDKYVKELEKTGRSKEIPQAKQHAEEIISNLKADLDDATNFRNGFAKGHVNYLKETNSEGYLYDHMNKLFPDKFPLDKKKQPKTLTPEQRIAKLKDELVEVTKGINQNSTPEELKKVQSAVESIENKINSIEAEIKKTVNSTQSKPKKPLTPEELTTTAKQLEAAINGDGPLLLDAPKSYKAKEKLKKAAEGQSSGPTIELPHKESLLNKNLSNIEGKPTPIKTNDQIKNYIQKNRWKGAASIGLGVGVVRSIFDKEDDDVITTTGKVVKTGASVLGATYLAELGLDYASNKDFQVANMWAKTTVQDYVKDQVAGTAEKIKDVAETERKMVSLGGKFGTTLKVGAGIVGVASIVDIGQKMIDNHEAKRMQREQEKNLAEKEKRRKEKNRENGYGYIQDGEILFELFGERTGHHKMGNSKFM